MNEINFISCGLLGDFIHCLSVVKNICQTQNAKANIYLTDKTNIYGGEAFALGCTKAHTDILHTVISQSFVNKFEVLPNDFNKKFINLNSWRTCSRLYYISWSDLLASSYNFKIQQPYKWIDLDKIDEQLKGRIIIHHSVKRYNQSFDWNRILQNTDEEFVFLTCSINEWDKFPFKNERLKLKLVSTIDEMGACINSGKLFIGNQSSPFALACALDVNRICELYYAEANFYTGENKYSEKMSWYLNDEKKYFNEKSIIKL